MTKTPGSPCGCHDNDAQADKAADLNTVLGYLTSIGDALRQEVGGQLGELADLYRKTTPVVVTPSNRVVFDTHRFTGTAAQVAPMSLDRLSVTFLVDLPAAGTPALDFPVILLGSSPDLSFSDFIANGGRLTGALRMPYGIPITIHSTAAIHAVGGTLSGKSADLTMWSEYR